MSVWAVLGEKLSECGVGVEGRSSDEFGKASHADVVGGLLRLVVDVVEVGCGDASSTAMAARYQHVTDPIRHVVAAQVGGLLWADEKAAGDGN